MIVYLKIIFVVHQFNHQLRVRYLLKTIEMTLYLSEKFISKFEIFWGKRRGREFHIRFQWSSLKSETGRNLWVNVPVSIISFRLLSRSFTKAFLSIVFLVRYK